MKCPSATTSRTTADMSEPHKSSQPNLSVERSGPLLETDDDIPQVLLAGARGTDQKVGTVPRRTRGRGSA